MILLNESINRTVAQPESNPIIYIRDTLFPRISDLITAPADNPDMIWTLAPMLIALTLMQIYFGRNKDEALGWNTAFGNSIALIFISISLLRSVFIEEGGGSISEFVFTGIHLNDIRILIIGAVFLYGIFLSMLSFFHWLPEKLAFFIMNGISINVTAYVGIVLVNAINIPLDRHTLFTGLTMFVIVYSISMIVRSFIPASRMSKIHLLERKRYIMQQKEKHFHHMSMKAHSDWRKKHLEAKAGKCQREAAKLAADINSLKGSRITK
jgi:hypothetical protein